MGVPRASMSAICKLRICLLRRLRMLGLVVIGPRRRSSNFRFLGAIPILFSILLVVLLVVGDEIGEGKAIVRCYEIDAVIGAAVVAVEILRAAHHLGEFSRWPQFL